MYCGQCGKMNRDGQKYCTFCGAPLSVDHAPEELPASVVDPVREYEDIVFRELRYSFIIVSVIAGLLTIYLLFFHQLQLESTGELHLPRSGITVFDYFQTHLFPDEVLVIAILILATIFSFAFSTGTIVGFACSVVFYLSYDKGFLIGYDGAMQVIPANITSTIFLSVVVILLSLVQGYIHTRLSKLVGEGDSVLASVLLGRD